MPGHDFAHGKKAPTSEAARRLDQALNAAGTLAALVDDQQQQPGALFGDGWHRTAADQLAEQLSTDAGPGDAITIAHEWLIAEPPQIYELRAGRRISRAMVEQVERRAAHLRRLDDHVGGSETYAMVSAELSATAGLLRDAAYTEDVARRLLSALADLSQLAGFVAADTGRVDDARRLYLAGVRAGHAAGDQASAANNLSALAYLESNTGDRKAAVTLARPAYTGARHAANPTGRALLLERVAWAHARTADSGAADRALGAVEDAYAHHNADEAPPWAYWLTPGEVEIMAGRVWTQLRRPLRAVPILQRAIGGYGDDVPRETSLYLTWLAESLIHAGEVDQAADAAVRALRLARRSGSARAVRRVADIGRMLAEVADRSAAVAAFMDERTAGGHPADSVGDACGRDASSR